LEIRQESVYSDLNHPRVLYIFPPRQHFKLYISISKCDLVKRALGSSPPISPHVLIAAYLPAYINKTRLWLEKKKREIISEQSKNM
jgi:hypothetical protein